MATTSDLRTGNIIRYNDDLYEVVEYQHINPGNWRAFVRLRLKNFKTGRTIEDRVRAGSEIDLVRVDRREMIYSYRDGDFFVFMDPETFEQINVASVTMGDKAQFLRENDIAYLIMEGETLLGVELPTFVVLTVTETTMAVRGDTATNITKPATLETGGVITVPGFINEGDTIKIDTRTSTYIERVTK
jgi:elongation factor P